MSFKRSNKMTVREQKTMDELFSIMSKSNDSDLQDLVNHRNLVRTFSATGMDSQESEQQHDPSDSDKNVSNAQREYDRQRIAARSIGTTSDTFDKNRAEVMRDSRHATPLSDANASKAKDVSAFARHPDQPAMDSHIVFRQEHMAKYR